MESLNKENQIQGFDIDLEDTTFFSNADEAISFLSECMEEFLNNEKEMGKDINVIHHMQPHKKNLPEKEVGRLIGMVSKNKKVEHYTFGSYQIHVELFQIYPFYYIAKTEVSRTYFDECIPYYSKEKNLTTIITEAFAYFLYLKMDERMEFEFIQIEGEYSPQLHNVTFPNKSKKDIDIGIRKMVRKGEISLKGLKSYLLMISNK